MLSPRSGDLRHRVKIQKPSTSRNTRGQRVDEWVFVGNASARIEQLSGTEAEDARQLHATATVRITLRHRRNFELTTKHRIEYRGRFYQVGHVANHDEINATWEVLASVMKP